MHQSAMFYGRRFFDVYCPPSPPEDFTLVEIGSQNVNGSLREVCPLGVKYVGLDFVDGKGVDIVITDPYKLPLSDASADMVISSSCFEHSEFFWLVFLEVMRVLKPDGVFYLNAPSNGYFHQWPVDCWRFYPDAGHAMVSWGRRNGLDCALLESFTGQRSAGRISEGGMWNDFVAVFLKDRQHLHKYPHRIIYSLSDFSNGYSSDKDGILQHCERGPDFSLIEEQESEINKHKERHKNAEAINEQAQAIVRNLRDEISLMQKHLLDARRRVLDIERSRSWQLTKPYRAVGAAVRGALSSVGRTGILLRIAVGSLSLPAAVLYHGGILSAVRAWRSESGLVRPLIENQEVALRLVSQQSAWVRKPVSVGFSLALRVRRGGSVSRSLGNFVRVVRNEGWNGVRRRLFASRIPSTPPLVCGRELPPGVARRVLVADYRVPRANVSAGERATLGILKDLVSLGYEVVFLANDMVPSPQYEAELKLLGIEVVTRDSGYVHSAHYVQDHGASFGTFYIIRVDVAEAILSIARAVAPLARIIFHAPDLYFLRERREAELQGDDRALQRAIETRTRELSVMRNSDRVIVVSPAEVPILRAELDKVPVSVFPVLYAPIQTAPADFNARANIFFLGGFSHSPNVDAVLWFASVIWPMVREALPQVEFHIVGAEAPASVKALGAVPGIRVVGFVPDLEPILANLRVGVAPLQYGAGIKGKVAMTLGAGIPCVCTEIAAEGMGIENGVHAFVANDPKGFADAVVKLYTDPDLWRRVSRAGQSLVLDRFGDAANCASLLKVLDQSRSLPIRLFCDYCARVDPIPLPNPDQSESVDVSIIIPVYNKWNLTRACISSVLRTSVGCGVRYEIILADDGSSDETLRASDIFPGLQVVKTPTNVGFLRNCNHAARFARGRHLLLLNNDTVVLPGWLESLYRTIENDPSIAIVGSKLLYPDGFIQEAGAALFSDGTAINVGRGSPRDTKVFNVPREVDYISGASIMIRGSFWDAIGGFDERYKNAYCEDSDLAMSARANSMRVVYQPLSEVIHFEHQSYTEQAPSHNSSLQSHNIALLLEKWRDVLRNDHLERCEWHIAAANAEREVPVLSLARRRTGRLNVLYFSPFPSHPASHGNRSTINQFARRFQSLGHKVHFVLLQTQEYNERDLADMAAAWDSLDVLPFSNAMLADGHEIPFDGWYEDGVGEQVRVLCDKYEIDIVFCSYVFQSKLLEFVPSYVLKVIDTHDKMGDRYEMLRQNGQVLEFFSCSPQEEGAYLRRADVVVARRAEEAKYFDSVTGRQNSIVIPHVEDPRFIDRSFDSLRNVGIVASANRVNLAIVRDCLLSIERRLNGESCPFVVHVAGQVKDMVPSLPATEASVFRQPWVNLHGFVPDIADFYSEMDAVVSPVSMGTGINVKTVQAMAFGMPLITTSWGGKGIETEEPRHNYANLDALADGLLMLASEAHELNRLAEVSRTRYRLFYSESLNSMRSMFGHPKLRGFKEINDVAPLNIGQPSSSTHVEQSQSKYSNSVQNWQRELGKSWN